MTLLVGVRCTDGVVVAADSAVTFGLGPGANLDTIQHKAQKITIIKDKLIVAGTGEVGLGQRFAETVADLYKAHSLEGTALQRARKISAAAIQDFQTTWLKQFDFGALVAFPASKGAHHLCEFGVRTMQPEIKDEKTWFVSMGSGQPLADPNLALVRDIFWQDGSPSVDDGIFAAVWCMHFSIKAAPGWVAEPIHVAVLQGGTARMLDQTEFEERLEHVKAAADHLRAFSPEKADAPEIPE